MKKKKEKKKGEVNMHGLINECPTAGPVHVRTHARAHAQVSAVTYLN